MKSPTKKKSRKAYDPAVSFRVPPEILAALADLEKATGLGRSAILRCAVLKGLPALRPLADTLTR